MVLEKIVEHVIERLRASGSIPLRVELWDGRRFDLAPAPAVTLRVAGPDATQALQAEPQIGALLPCNVVVRTDASGKTLVEMMDPRAVLELVGRPEITKIAGEVRSRLERVLAAV